MAIQHFQPYPEACIRLRYGHYWPKNEAPLALIDQVIIIPGRTTFIEQYQEVIDQILSQGRAVWILDLRGQGGSDRVGPDSDRSWVTDFDEYVEDLIAWIEQIILPTNPKSLSIMGVSLGSLCVLLLAIRAQVWISNPSVNQTIPKWMTAISKLILITPLVGVQNPVPQWILKTALSILTYIPEIRDRCLWGYSVLDPRSEEFLRAYQGTDLVRFQRYYDWIFKKPEYFVSGVSILWSAALMRALNRIQNFKKTGVKLNWPILIIEAGQDLVVDNQAVQDYLLPICQNPEFARFESASHNVFLEVDAVWDAVWKKINRFLIS